MKNIDAQNIKDKVDLLSLIGNDTELTRVADTAGGEYHGPCPWCGGKDRFRVQPYNPNGARFDCRKCGVGGDCFEYVMKRDGVSFPEAAEILSRYVGNPLCITPKKSNNQSQWIVAAMQFLQKAQDALFTKDAKKALDWLHNRGLNDNSLLAWGVGYNPEDRFENPEIWGIDGNKKIWLPRGVVIPCQDQQGLHYVKIRRSVGEKEKQKYHLIKGSTNWFFGGHTFKNKMTGFVFEAELDAILAKQESCNLGVGFGSMPAGKWIDERWKYIFRDIDELLICFDNDPPGQAAKQKLCNNNPQLTPSPNFPKGNDLTEMAQAGEDVFDFLWHVLEEAQNGIR